MAIGRGALEFNVSGNQNVAVGRGALRGSGGNGNIGIGYLAGNVGNTSNNIFIGNQGSNGSGKIILGTNLTHTTFFAAGIRGVTTGVADAIPVMIDSSGQLGTVSSSRRFKDDIRDMGTASIGLMKLRPVTYRYKQVYTNGERPLQYGLIAEEVAEVYPDLVVTTPDGTIETVQYQKVDAMLLNEVQRLHVRTEEQQGLIDTQVTLIEELMQRVEALESDRTTFDAR